MPKRLLRPVGWFLGHIQRHPGRLVATSTVILLLSLGILGYAITQSWSAAHQGRVDNCVAINELSRKIYVTLADFNVSLHDRAKFRPTMNCEAIP